MTLAPVQYWFLLIDEKTSSEQVLYHVEQPRGRFADGSSKPDYFPLTFELPVDILRSTKDWMESDKSTALRFIRKDMKSGKVVNHFNLLRTKISSKGERISRVAGSVVLAVIVTFEGVEDAVL